MNPLSSQKKHQEFGKWLTRSVPGLDMAMIKSSSYSRSIRGGSQTSTLSNFPLPPDVETSSSVTASAVTASASARGPTFRGLECVVLQVASGGIHETFSNFPSCRHANTTQNHMMHLPHMVQIHIPMRDENRGQWVAILTIANQRATKPKTHNSDVSLREMSIHDALQDPKLKL